MDALLRRREMMGAGGGTAGVVFYDKLIFDGTAYIETDITPPSDFSVRVPLGNESTKAAQRVFGVPGTNSSTFALYYGNSTTSTNRYFAVYYGASSSVSSNHYLAFSTKTFTFFLTPKRFGIGSTAWNITKGSETPSGALIIGYNSAKSGTPYTGEMKTFFIYDSDAQDATSASELLNNYTPEYTLRPCTYNGEAGLWCVETSKFYGNSAVSGTLTVQNDS